MKALSDEKIVASWMKYVDSWVAAVRNGEIDSRGKTTNQTILATVLAYDPKSILDNGCGEGWLVRELANAYINALGVDVVPALIESALDAGIGKFKVMSYEDITYDELLDKYDVVVSNFSLLADESVSEMFRNIPSILTDVGCFIVQTIHPRTACGDEDYKDGWRDGNWNGFSDKFTDPTLGILEQWTLGKNYLSQIA